MRRILHILLVFMAGIAPVSAEVPTDELIMKATSDAASPYYYPSLMMRYRECKALDDDEYFYLYYGHAFQEKYTPLAADPAMDRVKDILARIKIDTPSVRDIDELIMAGSEAMDFDPFSPQLLNIMAYAYGTAGDADRERAYAAHLTGVLRAIARSGDGLKEKSAMHVLMFSHALDLIASKNWDCLKARIISREVEYVPFARKHGNVKGYYFDYSRIYRNKPEGYTFKRERTWQFNNLKPREYK